MLRQTVLPFKMKRSNEKITTRSGVGLFAEFFEAMGIEKLVDKNICPSPDRAGALKPYAT